VTLVSKKFYLRRFKTLEFLDNISQLADARSISIYIPPGFTNQEINDLLYKSSAHTIPSDLNKLISDSKNGAALLWGDNKKCVVIPPFPIKEKADFDGYVIYPLHQLLTNDYLIGLVLVHLGSYAVGVCQGEKLISSKVGTGLIHGRHKKGGSSQQRFQRGREKQIREFLDKVCIHIREHFEQHSHLMDYIVYGGPRQTIILLLKRCAFLQSFEDRVLTSLVVPSLRQGVLETAISRIWSSCIIDWREE
jgi:hypothetical protein